MALLLPIELCAEPRHSLLLPGSQVLRATVLIRKDPQHASTVVMMAGDPGGVGF